MKIKLDENLPEVLPVPPGYRRSGVFSPPRSDWKNCGHYLSAVDQSNSLTGAQLLRQNSQTTAMAKCAEVYKGFAHDIQIGWACSLH